jgi:ankyrin repeat protein
MLNPTFEISGLSHSISPPPGEGGSKNLHQQARDGDADMLRAIFQNPKTEHLKHINDLDEKKLTPLHYAARHSNFEVMTILVENGADVNKLGDDNMTPLHYAARYLSITHNDKYRQVLTSIDKY